jgi:molybdate transport system regulatory protein
MAKSPTKPRLNVRIDFGADHAIGPGKVHLLEHIAKEGSISGAARAMGMSYRRAWLLVDDLNKAFKSPVVASATGGSGGGGAELTPTGRQVADLFRAIEKAASQACVRELSQLASFYRAAAEQAALARANGLTPKRKRTTHQE